MTALTNAQIKQFHEQGYILIEKVYEPEDLQPLRDELSKIVEQRARELHAVGLLRNRCDDEPFERRLAKLCAQVEDRSALLSAFEGKVHKTEGLFRVMTHSGLLDIVEALIGPEILAHPQFNLRAKLPGDPVAEVPWHQDLAYLEPEADQTPMVNFWIPLIDAPMETGALQVIPGSHLWGLLPHPRIEFDYLGLPDDTLPPHDVVDCPLPLGGVLVMQHKTVHRSVANSSDKVRWSVDIRYSDPAYPTGRPSVPGFLARSQKHPERVARSVHDWLARLEQAGK